MHFNGWLLVHVERVYFYAVLLKLRFQGTFGSNVYARLVPRSGINGGEISAKRNKLRGVSGVWGYKLVPRISRKGTS